jgi:hypothetical protein
MKRRFSIWAWPEAIVVALAKATKIIATSGVLSRRITTALPHSGPPLKAGCGAAGSEPPASR